MKREGTSTHKHLYASAAHSLPDTRWKNGSPGFNLLIRLKAPLLSRRHTSNVQAFSGSEMNRLSAAVLLASLPVAPPAPAQDRDHRDETGRG